MRGSASSEKSGLPYRQVPDIPEPRARNKACYTVVLINETGRSRQIELTSLRVRLAIGAAAAILVVVAVACIAAVVSLSGGQGSSGQDQMLAQKVRDLEEELRKKELALAVHEKRLEQEQTPPTKVSALPSMESEGGTGVGPVKESPPESESPLTSIHDPMAPEREDAAASRSTREISEGDQSPSVADRDLERAEMPGSSEPVPSLSTERGRSPSAPPIINFNAKEVTAVAESPNGGVLSFRLVKDRPEVRFAGYLFVYVEMVDDRGESKLYAYPKEARRGEGDLPLDYRQGESIAFKYNSRVELPYRDIRPGASLSGISILLYGEDGRIVFQRGFDRQEVKVVDLDADKTNGSRSRGNARRRAL